MWRRVPATQGGTGHTGRRDGERFHGARGAGQDGHRASAVRTATTRNLAKRRNRTGTFLSTIACVLWLCGSTCAACHTQRAQLHAQRQGRRDAVWSDAPRPAAHARPLFGGTQRTRRVRAACGDPRGQLLHLDDLPVEGCQVPANVQTVGAASNELCGAGCRPHRRRLDRAARRGGAGPHTRRPHKGGGMASDFRVRGARDGTGTVSLLYSQGHDCAQ